MDGIISWIVQSDPSVVPLGAIVTLMVLSLLRGWVIPRQTHLDRMSDLNRQLDKLSEERNDWKTAYTVEQTTNGEVLRQNSELIESAETSDKMLRELRDAANRNSGVPKGEA